MYYSQWDNELGDLVIWLGIAILKLAIVWSPNFIEQQQIAKLKHCMPANVKGHSASVVSWAIHNTYEVIQGFGRFFSVETAMSARGLCSAGLVWMDV